MIGYVEANGRAVIQDTWINSYTAPRADSLQSLKNREGTFQNGVTTLKFSRKRSSDDAANDVQFTDEDDGCFFVFPVNGGAFNAAARVADEARDERVGGTWHVGAHAHAYCERCFAALRVGVGVSVTIARDGWLSLPHVEHFRATVSGDVRVNGNRVEKRSTMVSPGDVLTFAQGKTIRVIRIEALGARRGPAPEAQALYEDLSPPEPRSQKSAPENPAFEGKGRPTKRDRRILDLSRSRSLE